MGIVEQKNIQDFVNIEVKSNVNDMVQDLIEAGKIDIFEHIIPKTDYDSDLLTQEEVNNIIDNKKLEIERLNNNLLEITSDEQEISLLEDINDLEDDIYDLENLEFDFVDEPMEYYIVSSFLAEQLKKKGEIIIDSYMAPIWGRTCSGQSIILDGVIIEIAREFM